MKSAIIEIEAKRENNYHQWQGRSTNAGKFNMSACESDVNQLYEGLKHTLKATFVVSTRRPRVPGYHAFEYIGNYTYYRVIETTFCNNDCAPCIILSTTRLIRAALRRKGAVNKDMETVYVWIY